MSALGPAVNRAVGIAFESARTDDHQSLTR
jgi:hypothetical protein